MTAWNILLRDHHPGYISWDQHEANQKLICYHCRGDDSHVGGWLCIGIGGVRVDRAVAAQIVEAVSEHAVEAAIQAADQSLKADGEIRQALCQELEEARTKPRWPLAGTRSSTQQSVSSRANLRRAGIRRWNGSPT